jgi:syntaxin-binding protein 5
MAHLLRGKQAGIHNDLSAGLGPDLFVLDHVCACGPYAPPAIPPL